MSRTVLTVDDSKAIRDMVALTLQPQGYRVIAATDGQDGLAKFQSEPVHLVITDLNMPVMNGFDFIQKLRTNPKAMGVPIVMLTTESKPEMKAKGKALGATGWINKPFDAAQLIAVTKKLAG